MRNLMRVLLDTTYVLIFLVSMVTGGWHGSYWLPVSDGRQGFASSRSAGPRCRNEGQAYWGSGETRGRQRNCKSEHFTYYDLSANLV